MDKIPVWNNCFNMNCNENKFNDSLSNTKNATLFYCLFTKKNNHLQYSSFKIKHIAQLIFNYAQEKTGTSQVIELFPDTPNTAFKCYFCSKHLGTLTELNTLVTILREESKFSISPSEMKVDSIHVNDIFPFRKRLISANLFDFHYFNFSKSSGEQISTDLCKSCPQFQLLVSAFRVANQKLNDLMV